MFAATNGHKEIVECLLSYGADRNAVDQVLLSPTFSFIITNCCKCDDDDDDDDRME